MKDAYGAVLTLIRGISAVTALVPVERIGSVVPPDGTDGLALPFVRLVDMPASRRPFGPGSGRLGMQLWRGIAQCYGPTRSSVTGDPIATGPITARQVAGAVSDGLHNRGPVSVGSTYLARVYAPEVSGQLSDPHTGWPFYTVRLEAYAGDQPVA
jgi:hypothetical protein